VPASCCRLLQPGQTRKNLLQGLFALGAGSPEAAEQQIVLDRHVGEQFAAFRHQTEAGLHAALQRDRADIIAAESDATFGLQQPHDGVEQRGLAGAVGADHGDQRARRHRDRDIMHHLRPSVGNAEVADIQ